MKFSSRYKLIIINTTLISLNFKFCSRTITPNIQIRGGLLMGLFHEKEFERGLTLDNLRYFENLR